MGHDRHLPWLTIALYRKEILDRLSRGPADHSLPTHYSLAAFLIMIHAFNGVNAMSEGFAKSVQLMFLMLDAHLPNPTENHVVMVR